MIKSLITFLLIILILVSAYGQDEIDVDVDVVFCGRCMDWLTRL